MGSVEIKNVKGHEMRAITEGMGLENKASALEPIQLNETGRHIGGTTTRPLINEKGNCKQERR
jgi:hypothetical protein